MSPAVRFWGAACGVAVGIAGLAATLIPSQQGTRMWLLVTWTAGVLCILFGTTALIGSGVGIREVLDAGSVRGALDAERRKRSAGETGFHGDIGWWTVATGGVLVAIYFLGWLILG